MEEVRAERRARAITAGAYQALAKYRAERVKERARILRVQNLMLVVGQRDRRKRLV